MKCRTIFFIHCFIAIHAAIAAAAEIRVPADHATIQSAINAAVAGDVIIVSPGTYRESIDFKGKAITVRSTDPKDPAVVAATTIIGDPGKPCVAFNSSEGRNSVISGLTLAHEDVTRSYPESPGISCNPGSPTISSNVITGNFPGMFIGGLGLRDASPLVWRNAITMNTGMGIWCYCGPSKSDIIGNMFLSNTGGGGIWITGDDRQQMLIEGNTFVQNSARYGGAISHDEGPSVICDNLVTGNVAETFGGGIDLGPMGKVLDNVIADNTGYGGICGPFAFYSCVISGNTITGCNGGIIVDNFDDGVMSNNTIVGNIEFGGICVGSRSCLLSGNLVAGNSSTLIAAGIELVSDTLATVAGCTIVGNRSSAGIGGLSCHEDSSVLVTNCIISGNTGPAANEAAVSDGPPPWSETSHMEIRHSFIKGGQNAVQIIGASSLAWGSGNIDADPLFVDPGHWDDNGTPAEPSDDKFDYHLLPGSPCIDAGTNDIDNPDTPEVETLPATDIAGIRRVIDGNRDGCATVDMGAYEYLPGDVNYDGKVNVLDLILVRNSMGRDPASSPAARKADLNADGRVDVLDLLAARNALNTSCPQ